MINGGNNMAEVWKDIKGYEGVYQVSNLGNVKSLNYGRTGIEHNLKQKIYGSGSGYYYVGLSMYGKVRMLRVHRLVAEAFIPNPQNLPQINHKDENHFNNNVDNLEWCDEVYNANYGTRKRRIAETRQKKYGFTPSWEKEKIKNEKLELKKIKQISKNGQLIKIWDSPLTASIELGIDISSICKCCKGKYKTAGGFIWKKLIS